jgi:hypothetical protein
MRSARVISAARILAFAVPTAAAILLAACSNPTGPGERPSHAATGKPATAVQRALQLTDTSGQHTIQATSTSGETTLTDTSAAAKCCVQPWY